MKRIDADADERWTTSEARALVATAVRHEIVVPPSARARVSGALQTRGERDAVRGRWAMFFAGAAIAGAALSVLYVRPRGAPIESVFVERAGARASLRVGDVLPTAAGLTRLDLRGAGRAVLGLQSSAVLERFDDAEVALRLTRGSLLLHVTPRADHRAVMVRAPGFVARVVGTVLRVVVDADGSSSIAVAHGAVEVVPLDGKPVLVHGGEHWPPRSTAAPTLEELGALPLDQREGVVLADFLPQVAKPTCAGDAASRLRCQLDLAQRAEADRAETALYEAGSIAWRELGDGKRALAIWRQQRQRFPNGVLRTEVQASIIDALVALRMLPEAETEIDRDLLADPEGLRTSEMHFVLGTIQRELDGDCRRARSQFSLALADPSGSAAARASEALRSCRRASHE